MLGKTRLAKIGIYLIFCISNEKLYVGSSARSLAGRLGEHRRLLKRDKHKNIKLQRAFNKYGEESFLFLPLEYVDEPSHCIEREQFWIDRLLPYLNISLKAGSRLGVKHSEEARERISLSHKGLKVSPEHRAKIAAGHRGKKHSPQHIANFVKARAG